MSTLPSFPFLPCHRKQTRVKNKKMRETAEKKKTPEKIPKNSTPLRHHPNAGTGSDTRPIGGQLRLPRSSSALPLSSIQTSEANSTRALDIGRTPAARLFVAPSKLVRPAILSSYGMGRICRAVHYDVHVRAGRSVVGGPGRPIFRKREKSKRRREGRAGCVGEEW